MCVAAIAWHSHPDWPLVVAGNRDEFHARASSPLARWDDGRGVIAGRDLVGGGTWMGVTEAGTFALVTNYRVPEGAQPGRPSRGILVTDLLQRRSPQPVESMNPFNLVEVADGQAWFRTNYPRIERRPLEPGIHGLSNGGFDVRWPKTLAVEQAVSAWLRQGGDFSALFAALRSEFPDPKQALCEHGPEPAFAPVFIKDPIYGTRCSTVLAVAQDGSGLIVERSFDTDGEVIGEVSIPFAWAGIAHRKAVS